MTKPVTLAAQIEEVAYLQATRRTRVTERPSEVATHDHRLAAVLKTLTWLQEHEVELRAFLALARADRAVIVSHGHFVAELAGQLKRREEIAKAGGPVR